MKPPIEFINERILGFLTSGVESFLLDYLEALPILVGVSIGVYALTSMVSSTLAKIGVFGVFVYGALVVLV